MNFYDYHLWLVGLSILFVAWELFQPLKQGRFFRRELLTDVFHILLNAKLFGVLIAGFSVGLAERFDALLFRYCLHGHVHRGIVSDWPIPVQFAVCLVVIDFLKYLIHNCLHRVPRLWEFHKVHHSIQEFDWIGNWRFHWFEAVFYNVLLYVPALFFGFSPYALFWYAIFGTFVGHFAHANLKVSIGPLKYVINSPELHVWHHVHPDDGPVNRNFGVVLSVWDWIFGTAHLPSERKSIKLGFAGIERFPRSAWRQLLAPFGFSHPRPETHRPADGG